MKSYLILIIALFVSGYTFCQETEWELYTTVDGVEIYTKYADCHAKNIPDQKAVIIKVVNTTGSEVTIEWDRAIWYNDKRHDSSNASDGENHYTVTIPANGTKEGDCETPRGALYIYKDFITYETDVKLSRFELENIKVTPSK